MLLDDALRAAPLLERYEGAVIDVGSGGGSPGIPLAAALPERAVTLLDAEQRKCDFLRRWAPPTADVVWGRAEEAHIAYAERFNRLMAAQPRWRTRCRAAA